jgi:hypothetical protein
MPRACPRRTVCGGGDGISYGRGTPRPPITPSPADIPHLALGGIRATYMSPLCNVPTRRTGKGEVHLGRRYPTPRPRWATGDACIAPVHCADLQNWQGRGTPRPQISCTSPADIPHLARQSRLRLPNPRIIPPCSQLLCASAWSFSSRRQPIDGRRRHAPRSGVRRPYENCSMLQ